MSPYVLGGQQGGGCCRKPCLGLWMLFFFFVAFLATWDQNVFEDVTPLPFQGGFQIRTAQSLHLNESGSCLFDEGDSWRLISLHSSIAGLQPYAFKQVGSNKCLAADERGVGLASCAESSTVWNVAPVTPPLSFVGETKQRFLLIHNDSARCLSMGSTPSTTRHWTMRPCVLHWPVEFDELYSARRYSFWQFVGDGALLMTWSNLTVNTSAEWNWHHACSMYADDAIERVQVMQSRIFGVTPALHVVLQLTLANMSVYSDLNAGTSGKAKISCWATEGEADAGDVTDVCGLEPMTPQAGGVNVTLSEFEHVAWQNAHYFPEYDVSGTNCQMYAAWGVQFITGQHIQTQRALGELPTNHIFQTLARIGALAFLFATCLACCEVKKVELEFDKDNSAGPEAASSEPDRVTLIIRQDGAQCESLQQDEDAAQQGDQQDISQEDSRGRGQTEIKLSSVMSMVLICCLGLMSKVARACLSFLCICLAPCFVPYFMLRGMIRACISPAWLADLIGFFVMAKFVHFMYGLCLTLFASGFGVMPCLRRG